jgi:hypothetical protein
MIATIRVRFTPTPAARVWDDASFNNWLNTGIQFSLAHFWSRTSFGQADLRYQLFPPIVMDDPRANMRLEERAIWGKDREYLVNGVTAKISSDFKPDWGAFDALLIWFAQPTDLFGGGGYPVQLGYVAGGGGLLDFIFGKPKPETKYLPAAVCDIASPFDSVCQELGHAFGLEHPLDSAGNDYGDPYDSMAAQVYGGKVTNFVRPANPSLPVGLFVDAVDQNAVVGPLVSAAHIYNSPFGQKLKNSGLFVEVSASYLTGASSFKLHALDDAVDRWPAQIGPVLAVLPPSLPNGNTYFLELRRSAVYDSGVRGATSSDATRPPIGVVIHYFDAIRKRVVYVDTLPLVNNRGDRDYRVASGAAFTVRVTSIGQDYRSVGLTVGGGNFWRQFGIDLDDVRDDEGPTGVTPWERAEVSPCFLFPVGEYFFRTTFTKHTFTLIASSFGYERPGYTWTINSMTLNPTANSVAIAVEVEIPKPEGGNQTTVKTVTFAYTLADNILTLTCQPYEGHFVPTGNLNVLVEVKAAETSPGVLKNFYEDRSVVTALRFHNMVVEWDDNYKKRIADCEAAIDAVNRKRIPIPKLVPEPEPDPFDLRLRDVLNGLIQTNPAAANAVIEELSRLANVQKIDVLKRL